MLINGFKILIVSGLAVLAFYPKSDPVNSSSSLSKKPIFSTNLSDPPPTENTISPVDAMSSSPSNSEDKHPLINEPRVSIPEFIQQDQNKIQSLEYLRSFFEKLNALEQKQRQQVRIIHIGDSHLQAGQLSGKLRRLLQSAYGNAGRGLVFPYRLARSNAPADLYSKSNVSWERQMNIQGNHKIPVGISGFSLRTYDSNFRWNFKIREAYQEDYTFDKLTLINQKGSSIYTSQVVGGWHETCPENAKTIPHQNTDISSSSIFFEMPQTAFSLFGKKEAASQKQFILQGTILENTQSTGVLYHMIGVNGATYRSYNRSQDFIQQLNELDADLIIISLGTNEAYDANYSDDRMSPQINKFVEAIQQETNCDAILLVSPNDILLQKKYKTKHPQEVSQLLNKKSNEYQTAFWDFYQIMGAEGSIRTWQTNGLAQRDYIHLTKGGYEVAAQLLFDAINNAYKNYKK
ncbi:MAG: GDSL-type esterase/lipase family protein [Saprospiraceae bacterium]|nr:GDSL-type esterase/lipase family protein [Saprospiraceae bacterium]